MVLALLALALQAPGTPVAPAADRPVRVWLDPGGRVVVGDLVRVYVETAADGYVVALRLGTNGRVEVLFPRDPAEDLYVPAGTYEVRRAGEAATFLAAEPLGSGVVLVALSPAPFRFDAFVRAGVWNPDALVASWTGTDAQGTLLDIVQQMLGDGYFNYDIVAYAVVPRPVPAPTPMAESSPDYAPSSIRVIVLVEALPLVVLCDPFFGACELLPFLFPRRPLREPGCDLASGCAGRTSERFIALNTQPTSRTTSVPRSIPPPRSARPERGPAPRRIEPRPRLPEQTALSGTAGATRAVSLLRGTRVAAAPHAAVPSSHQIRLVMSRTRARVPSSEAVEQRVTSLARVAAPARPPAASSPSATATLAQALRRTRGTVPAGVMPVVTHPSGRSASTTAAVSASTPARTIALPRAASAGTGVRVGAVPVRVPRQHSPRPPLGRSLGAAAGEGAVSWLDAPAVGGRLDRTSDAMKPGAD